MTYRKVGKSLHLLSHRYVNVWAAAPNVTFCALALHIIMSLCTILSSHSLYEERAGLLSFMSPTFCLVAIFMEVMVHGPVESDHHLFPNHCFINCVLKSFGINYATMTPSYCILRHYIACSSTILHARFIVPPYGISRSHAAYCPILFYIAPLHTVSYERPLFPPQHLILFLAESCLPVTTNGVHDASAERSVNFASSVSCHEDTHPNDAHVWDLKTAVDSGCYIHYLSWYSMRYFPLADLWLIKKR